MPRVADLRDRSPFYKSLAPLVIWQELARPVDWAAQFGRAAPLSLEIGSGNGEFLARTASEHPERNYVGVDLRWACIKRTLRNLAKVAGGDDDRSKGRGNVRLVMEDARPSVERLFAPRSLEQVFVLFPCPWRKEKHEHHRLLRHSFLELLNNRLVDGGEALLVTDWTPFRDWTLVQAEGTGLRAEARDVEARLGTKYERKWHGRGQRAFHEVRLVKEEHRDAPVLEDIPLNPPHLARIDPDRLELDEVTGPITITFKESVRDRERGIVMVRTVVVEGPLTQQFWITIARAGDGSWWIVPARGCQTVPTAGVQQALEHVADCARATVANGAASAASADSVESPSR